MVRKYCFWHISSGRLSAQCNGFYMGMERAVYQCSTGVLYLAFGGVFAGKCFGSGHAQIAGFKKGIMKGQAYQIDEWLNPVITGGESMGTKEELEKTGLICCVIWRRSAL